MHCIGENRTERLDVVPAQLRVRVTIRPSYGCRGGANAREGRASLNFFSIFVLAITRVL
jgi:hypothetical protein